MLDSTNSTLKRVGVIRGGTGGHYLASLKKGKEIISHLFDRLPHKYKVSDILIDKDHVWHLNGLPVSPGDLSQKIDIAWNTAHPSYSAVLESLSIPHIAPNAMLFALENNREMLEKQVGNIGIPMPKSVLLSLYQRDFDGPIEKYPMRKAKEIFEKFSSPWIVRSFTEDKDMAVHLAKTFPELVRAIEDGVKHKKSILVEEFIAGKVASLHTMPDFRNEKIYSFPLGATFGELSGTEREKLYSLARDLHQYLGAGHYLKSDFVLNPSGKVYLLQITSTPDLKDGSHLTQVCESAGVSPSHVLEHILG